jgi:2-oxoglutarate ferredoxin oxidoreductase subunit beta
MTTGTEEIVFKRPESLTDVVTHYCPGCGHGIIHRIVAEVIDELGVRERTVSVAPVGCSVLLYFYIDVDSVEAAHGRAPAVATGIKRARPDLICFTYQGDGDLAAIGTNEILHAANRGENFTTIFVNNAIYGMTGGQMAPTTLIGQKSETTPRGRSIENEGYPIHVCELLSTLEAPSFIERVSVHDVKHIRQAKKAIFKAFKNQVEGKPFSLVECLSMCPTNWHVDPASGCRFVEEKMVPVFPLGNFRDK